MIHRIGLLLVTALAAVAVHADGIAVPSVSQEALLDRQQQADPALLVLDVRTPEEYASGHVPGAVNIPYDQVGSRLAELPRDKDIVVYCRSGRRAQLAADVLAANGYTHLQHLQGDIAAWLEQGRPVEKPAGTPPPGQP